MIISFFETEPWEQKILTSALPTHQLQFIDDPLTQENAIQAVDTEILSTFIYSNLTSSVLTHFPNLKLIATRSTGYDHIDIEYCKQKGISVCNVPTYGVNTIAEHTFALMLALSRRIIPSVERTRKGDFSLENLRGFDLAGKTLGIVGLGHIGTRVAELAQAFHMNILATTAHPNSEKAKMLNVQFVDLPTLLGQSDIISIHVPLNSHTSHLINKDNISFIKRGSYLINTARGPIVETEAILLALEQGILAGAGIDVLEEECVLKEERELLTREILKTCDLKTQLLNHVLLTKNNVIVTPHNAFNSQEALQEILSTTIQNITSHLQGSSQNIVK